MLQHQGTLIVFVALSPMTRSCLCDPPRGLYAIYFVSFPRASGKENKTAAYADCSVSAVPDHMHARYGHIPGARAEHCRFRAFSRDFTSVPLQDVSRAVRSCHDLDASGAYGVLWVLWLTQCQGVQRYPPAPSPHSSP